MVAAIFAARNGRTAAILEANDILGKKLLATGNGKCNFTNEYQSRECYRGGCPDAAMELLKKFGVREVLRFFEELGIYPRQRNGYWYPNSEQAASVREVLEAEIHKYGVEVYTNCHLSRAVQQRDGFLLEAELRDRLDTVLYERTGKADGKEGGMPGKSSGASGKQEQGRGKKKDKPIYSEPYLIELKADYLILATGGMAGNIKGADGSGYQLAKSLGHSIITPVPALVQLKAAGDYLKTLAGVRTEAAARLLAGEQEYREQGEFLFTEYGISGIPAMQLSRYASVLLNRSKNPGNIELFLDFFPVTVENDLKKRLQQRFRAFPERRAEQVLTGLLPSKLNQALLTQAGIAADRKGAEPGEDKIALLAGLMKNFRLEITGTNTFENAQVTAGGVSMEELDHDSMESKITKQLFITGELADIDGTCGGYNLQWAWMTGMAAAERIGGRKSGD